MTPEDDTANVYRFFTEVGIIDQLISTRLEAHLPGRMTATQFGLLGHLARRPDGETPLQLANAFEVPKTSMTHMLGRLEELQLVVIAVNPRDGRSKIVQCTEAGQRFLGEKMAAIAQEMSPIIGDLGTEPFTQSLPHLAQIREALDRARD